MIYKILNPKAQFYIFIVLFFILYTASPLIIYYGSHTDPYMWQLAVLSSLSLLFILMGYFGSPKVFSFRPIPLWSLKANTLIVCVFSIFLIFLLAVITTAKSIPLLDSFKGHSINELVIARANFLKARVGYERILLYLNALLTTSFIPYVIILSFVLEYRYKWFLLLVPYAYSLLFLEKAFFLKFILPFLSFCSSYSEKKNYRKYFWFVILSIPLLIYVNTVLSGFGGSKTSDPATYAKNQEVVCANFYSAEFASCVNHGRLEFIAWRILAVPIFSATDSLKLFDIKYNHQYLMGKTSLIVSLLTHQKRIHFEREVFNSEWGADITKTASSNSVYIIEQFVNFGWVGCICASLLVGFMFRFLTHIGDTALSSLTIIFSFAIFLGGLIPVLISGGYLLLCMGLYFTKLEKS